MITERIGLVRSAEEAQRRGYRGRAGRDRHEEPAALEELEPMRGSLRTLSHADCGWFHDRERIYVGFRYQSHS